MSAEVIDAGSLTFDPVSRSITRTVGSWSGDGIVEGSNFTITDSASNNIEFIVDSVPAQLGPDVTVLVAQPITTETSSSARINLNQAVVEVVATVDGSTDVSVGALNTLVSTRNGVSTVYNTTAGESGSNQESDADLRFKRTASFQLSGRAVDGAIRARILELDEVEECLVISNRTNSTDSEGRPAKSFEAVVYPAGVVGSEIATIIFNSQPAGIESFGSEVYSVVDTQGTNQTVKFSYAEDVDIYATAEVTIDATKYPADGDEQIKQAILKYGDSLSVGDDALSWRATAEVGCAGIDGILNLIISLGTAPNPSGRTDVQISDRQKAVFSELRIEVIR